MADLTNEEAQKLLEMGKKIWQKGNLLDVYPFEFPEDDSVRYDMKSLDRRYSFLLQIRQKLDHTKITFHFQENQRFIGLLRIDFNGPPHQNPEVVNESVPDWLAKYQGRCIEGSHVHYYVQGYRSLAWACPLKADGFPVKTMQGIQDFDRALNAFCQRIHLLTKFTGEGRLLL